MESLLHDRSSVSLSILALSSHARFFSYFDNYVKVTKMNYEGNLTRLSMSFKIDASTDYKFVTEMVAAIRI